MYKKWFVVLYFMYSCFFVGFDFELNVFLLFYSFEDIYKLVKSVKWWNVFLINIFFFSERIVYEYEREVYWLNVWLVFDVEIYKKYKIILLVEWFFINWVDFYFKGENVIKLCWKMKLKKIRRKVKYVRVVGEIKKENVNLCMVSRDICL